MAKPVIPVELQDEYTTIFEKLTAHNSNWGEKKNNDVAWGILKKRYYKDEAGQKWTLRSKFNRAIGEDIDSYMALLFKKEDYEEGAMPEYMKNMIHLTAKATIIDPPDKELLASIDWNKTLLKAGLEPIETEIDPIADDILYTKLDLIHSAPYMNSNNYVFSADDIYSAVLNGQFQPSSMVMVDVNHQYNPYGAVIKGGHFQENLGRHGEVTTLEVIAAVWAWRFPGLADEMRMLAATNQLEWSMACTADGVRCGMCGETYPNMSEACEHIQNREAPIHVIGPHFKAASIILDGETPADRFAKSKEVTYRSEDDDETKTANLKSRSDAYIESLPDMSFAFVKEGEKEETTPKTRLFAHHSKEVKDADDHSSVNREELSSAFSDLFEPDSLLSTVEKEQTYHHLKLHSDNLLSIDEFGEITSTDNFKSFEEEILMDKTVEVLQAELKEALNKIKAIESADDKAVAEATAKEIADLTAKVTQLEAAIAQAKTDHEAAVATVEGERDGLTAKVATLEQEKTDLEAAKADLEDKLKAFEQVTAKSDVETKNEERKTRIEAAKEVFGEDLQATVDKYALTYDDEKGEVEGVSDDNFELYISGVEAGLTKTTKKSDRSDDINANPDTTKGETKMGKLFKSF